MKGDIVHNDLGPDTGAPAESYEPPLGGELLRWKQFAAVLWRRPVDRGGAMTRRTSPLASHVQVDIRGLRWYHWVIARVLIVFCGPRRSFDYLISLAEYRVNGGEWRRLNE